MDVVHQAFLRFGQQNQPDSIYDNPAIDLNRILVAFNGGKDCTILLHLISLALDAIPGARGKLRLVYFRDVPEETFPQVEDFVEEVKSRYNMECIEVTNGDMKAAMEYIVSHHPEIQAIFMGTRATDPNAGWMDYFCSTSSGWPLMNLVAPILHMTYSEVWRIINDLNIPYCSLYQVGYTSIGKRSNTKPNPILKRGSGYAHADQLEDESQERLGRL